jgi:hypothetical protein
LILSAHSEKNSKTMPKVAVVSPKYNHRRIMRQREDCAS